MDRRKFLAGSVAVGATSLAVNSNAGIADSSGHTTIAANSPRNKTTSNKRSQYRLKYPVTQEEKASGKVVHNLTYPTHDNRRYTIATDSKIDFDSPDFAKDC